MHVRQFRTRTDKIPRRANLRLNANERNFPRVHPFLEIITLVQTGAGLKGLNFI